MKHKHILLSRHPTEPFAILESQTPPTDLSELHKIGGFKDSEALKNCEMFSGAVDRYPSMLPTHRGSMIVQTGKALA